MSDCPHPLARQMYRAVYGPDAPPSYVRLTNCPPGNPTPSWLYKEDWCMDCGAVLRRDGDLSERPQSWPGGPPGDSYPGSILGPSETESPSTVRALSPKEIQIVYRVPGYAHTRMVGVCGSEVTVEDVMRFCYHEYFGGREPWVRNGEWGCVRHDD